MAVFDKKVKKQKAAEIFKQANRGTAGDGDHSELDWDEFEFAFRKLAEHLGCSRLPARLGMCACARAIACEAFNGLALPETRTLTRRDTGVHPMDVWCVAKPGLRAAQGEQIPMTDGLTELFTSFAAGDDPAKSSGTAQVICAVLH